MRQVTKTVYTFNELTEKAQEKALKELWDINVELDWYDFIYEETESLGFKILAFDVYTNTIETKWIESYRHVAENIIAVHGRTCKTYVDAKQFLDKYIPLCDKFNKMSGDEDNYYDIEENLEEMCKDFERSIEHDYWYMLSKEYEYLTSEEAIKETIEDNEYEFDENGNLI